MSLPLWLDALRIRTQPQLSRSFQSVAGHRLASTRRLLMERLEDRSMLAFSPAVEYPLGAESQYPHELVTADFNNDGRLDLAVAEYNSSDISVLLGNADGTFGLALTSPAGSSQVSIAVGDFDEDGNLDLATTNWYDVTILRGKGDGTFQPPTPLGTVLTHGRYDYLQSVAVGDFNGDGNLDLGVTVNHYSYSYSYYGTAQVLLGNGEGSFSAPKTSYLDLGWYVAAVAADFNGDQIDDFAVANQHFAYVLLGDSSGYLTGLQGFEASYSPESMAVGDVNGDLKPDLVTTDYYENTVSVLLGDGLGDFAAAQHYATGSTPNSIVLGDFSGDAKIDIATADEYGSVSILRGAGNGAFSTAENFTTGADISSGLTAGDFNGDGWLDVALADYSGGSVSVLINDRSWASQPRPAVSLSNASITEGNTGTANATFTVTLSAASGVDVTVQYATADITAAAGSDYTAASGSVIIPAGQTSARFAIAVRADRLAEPTETFAANLSSATNAMIVDGQGIGTILDDEPRISISDVTKTEGRKGTTYFTFTVTLSAAYDQAVTMSFQTANGTATTANRDYVAKSGTLTFNPGETSKTITIAVNGDRNREANELFYVDLSNNSSNSIFTKKRGTGTILNDDR